MIEFLTNFGEVVWALKWVLVFIAVMMFVAFKAEAYGPIDEDQIAP